MPFVTLRRPVCCITVTLGVLFPRYSIFLASHTLLPRYVGIDHTTQLKYSFYNQINLYNLQCILYH